MTYVVHNASGARLLTTSSFLAARRRWSRYLSTSPVLSEVSGLDVRRGEADDASLDLEALDRVTGYASPDEREPTDAEVMAALLS